MKVMIMQRKDGRDAHEYTVQGSELVTDVVKRFLNRDGISPVVLFKIKLGKKPNKWKHCRYDKLDGITVNGAGIEDGMRILVLPRSPTKAEEREVIKVRNVFFDVSSAPDTSFNCTAGMEYELFRDIHREDNGEGLGSGGFGCVYKGTIRKTGQQVAVKEIMGNWTNRNESEVNTLRKRYMREVLIMATMKHPAVMNIVGYTPFEYSDTNRPALLMPIMKTSLQKMISLERKGLCPDDWDLSAKHMAIYGTACGMCFLHANRIIHRDLKPDNVLLDDKNLPHITDFGLSKFVPKGQTREQSTCAGTAMYQAPELVRGELDYTEKVDVYAFGMLMYAVLSGDNPFSQAELGRWYLFAQDIDKGKRPVLRGIVLQEQYHKLIEMCWDPAPAARPSFNQIVQELGREEYLCEGIDVDFFKEYQAQVCPEKFVTATRRKVSFQSVSVRSSCKITNKSSTAILIESAESGTVDSMYKLAQRMRDGEGMEKDEKQAFTWFEKSYQRGLKKAVVDIGKCYENGTGVACDREKAVHYYKLGVEYKIPEAMFLLGKCYFYGNGVTRNEIEAAKLFRKAAEDKNRYGDAESFYGYCLEQGRGCKADVKKAFQYYIKANQHGSVEGMYNFADMLFHGQTLEQSVPQACDLFWLAARKGQHDAYYALYQIYSRGYKDVEKDIESARRAAFEGSKAENMRSMLAYADIIESGHAMFGETDAQAKELRSKALSRSFVFSQNNFGVDLCEGKGCFCDNQEGVKFFRISAENGNSVAWQNLGLHYETGNGCPQDYNEAEKCFRKSIEMGHEDTCQHLASLLYDHQKYDEAFVFANRAAKHGVVASYSMVGRMYMKGQGCTKDQQKGFEFYQKGAQADVPEGLYKAGCCYMKGKGTSKDLSQAKTLLSRAEAEGNQDISDKAKRKLAVLS